MATTHASPPPAASAAPDPDEPPSGPVPLRRERALWRSRWAAIGAAVAVAFGGGTLHLAGASSHEPSGIVAVTPVRILDTRDPTDLGLPGPFVSAVGQELQVTGTIATVGGEQTVVPDGATGVLLNVTVVVPSADGFVSIRPAGTGGAPTTSNLNFEAGDITPNAVFVALPTSGASAGRIELLFDAFGVPGPTTDLLADVVGYTVTSPTLAPDEIDAYTRAEADERFVQTTDEIGVSGYQRVENLGDFNTDSVKSVLATCPEGTVVTGGGGLTFPSLADPNRDEAPLTITLSEAFGERSWQYRVNSTDPDYEFAWRIRAQAICVKVADD